MFQIGNMPVAGSVVIVVIAGLFILSLILLFSVFGRYKALAHQIRSFSHYQNSRFLTAAVDEFSRAYKLHGADTNTPAVVESVISSRLSGSLLAERFLNNAVSLFVTLGLFGTFLGLSLSVSSLTELISLSNTSEWLNVLDSVGGGLISALSGMGVAFYTSLVGVACSIILTILRTIFNPQSQRAVLENQLELWLDQIIAPTLSTDRAKDQADIVRMMVDGMNKAADQMEQTMKASTDAFRAAIADASAVANSFNGTVSSFNKGIRDFSEFDYNLRGTVERMDVAARDLTQAVRNASRSIERSVQD